MLPPVEACLRNRAPAGEPRNGITEQLDLRLDPSATGWLSVASSVAELRGWVRYALGRDVAAFALVCLADALLPVTFALGLTGWVPTVELTGHRTGAAGPGLAAGGAAGAADRGRLAGRGLRIGTSATSPSPIPCSWPATALVDPATASQVGDQRP